MDSQRARIQKSLSFLVITDTWAARLEALLKSFGAKITLSVGSFGGET